jgi:hypothetical protein
MGKGVPKIIEISAGSRHFSLLDRGGNCYGYGFSELSQLGHQCPYQPDPILIPGAPRGSKIKSFADATLLVVGMTQSVLGEDMLKLLRDDQSLKNCTIVAGEHQIRIHAVVVQARLRKLKIPADGIIKLVTPVFDDAVLQSLAEFLYCDRLGPFSDYRQVLQDIANELGLSRLASLCSTELDVQSIKDTTLVADLSAMVGDPRWSDFVIHVEDSEKNIETDICVHKALLMRNAYFGTLLASGLDEVRAGRVTIRDCSNNAVQKILQFVYADAYEDFTGDDCIEVLIASSRLLISRLKESEKLVKDVF